MRMIVISWLVEVACEYELHQETLFLAAALLDRFMSIAKVNLAPQPPPPPPAHTPFSPPIPFSLSIRLTPHLQCLSLDCYDTSLSRVDALIDLKASTCFQVVYCTTVLCYWRTAMCSQ